MKMSLRSALALLVCAAALVTPASVFAAHSVGTHEQVAWVRRAATRFVTAELTRNGAEACAVLDAPLRATQHGRTCEQRWDVRLGQLLREPGSRMRLRAQRRGISSAAVIVHGNTASLGLATPLMSGSSHFTWSESCWMLEG
jgi:hypothetical protein